MDKTLAARIALLVISLGATAALFTSHLSQENFMILATAIFGAFFVHE
jgi:hypothetical protein